MQTITWVDLNTKVQLWCVDVQHCSVNNDEYEPALLLNSSLKRLQTSHSAHISVRGAIIICCQTSMDFSVRAYEASHYDSPCHEFLFFFLSARLALLVSTQIFQPVWRRLRKAHTALGHWHGPQFTSEVGVGGRRSTRKMTSFVCVCVCWACYITHRDLAGAETCSPVPFSCANFTSHVTSLLLWCPPMVGTCWTRGYTVFLQLRNSLWPEKSFSFGQTETQGHRERRELDCSLKRSGFSCEVVQLQIQSVPLCTH